ncbi:MAG: DUF4411 family protein [Coriobacteriia bacterium]
MFLLDANVFITAKNTYYGTDFAPGFWNWIAEEHDVIGLGSVVAVREELLAQEDALSDWTRSLPDGFWLEEAGADVVALRDIATWAMSGDPRFRHEARIEFLASADFRLLGQALAGKHAVVTHEVAQPEGKKKIKIPDVCAAFGVEQREPFELFRHLGLHLVRP